MDKRITLPEDVVKKLKILAAMDNNNVKAYIESLVIKHVYKTKIK